MFNTNLKISLIVYIYKLSEIYLIDDFFQFYSNCECTMNTALDPGDLELTLGRCRGDCAWLYVFSALFVVVMMLTFDTMSPGTIALFR